MKKPARRKPAGAKPHVLFRQYTRVEMVSSKRRRGFGMKPGEGFRHWTPEQADAMRERLVALLVRVLPLQPMSPLQQLGVGCDQHGAVCDRRRRNDVIRRITVEIL